MDNDDNNNTMDSRCEFSAVDKSPIRGYLP